ncbi:MAG: metal ABC transporter permease [Actinomycetota bacterium]|nr:metal ABC transporter permease [Actinomycetota bacterium]
MIEWLTEPISHGTTLRALIEIALLGAVGGAVGCWIVLYEISYSAESLAHGLFPGLVGAALLGLPILLGGAAGIVVAALLITVAGRIATDTADTAIAVVVTSLFGLGVLLALSPQSPPGIQTLLFGDLLGTADSDLAIAAGVAVGVIGLLWLFHDRLLAIGFDGSFGRTLGISPGLVTAMLLCLVAVTILVSVQGLGNLLVAAVLVGPAAAARLLTTRFADMAGLSVGIAVISGVAGVYLSFYAKTAAGASIVACLVVAYLACAGLAYLRRRPSKAPGRRAASMATLNQ